MEHTPVPEITVKLTTKGTYVWSITVPRDPDYPPESWVSAIKSLDMQLKDVFPSYAKPGTGKSYVFEDEV